MQPLEPLRSAIKAGSRNDVTNYGGIAILSAIAKLFELLIYKNMYKDLQRLISENQHGYVKGRSTVSNLLEYTFHPEVYGRWFTLYRLIQSIPIFLKLLTKYGISCF
jgi:hypothetical protein